ICVLLTFGADGRVTLSEVFEAEREADALVRFDAVTGGCDAERSPEPFANAASNALRVFEQCWRVRDWSGVVATYHRAHRMDDRRRLMRMEVAGDAFFANERVLFEDMASEWHGDLLATRGD